MIGFVWTLTGFVLMELFSWVIHKFIMHGPLWKIHQSHHIHTKGFSKIMTYSLSYLLE